MVGGGGFPSVLLRLRTKENVGCSLNCELARREAWQEVQGLRTLTSARLQAGLWVGRVELNDGLECPHGIQVREGTNKPHFPPLPGWLPAKVSVPLPCPLPVWVPKLPLLQTVSEESNTCSFSFSPQIRLWRIRRYRACILFYSMVFYPFSDLASPLYIFTFTCH